MWNRKKVFLIVVSVLIAMPLLARDGNDQIRQVRSYSLQQMRELHTKADAGDAQAQCELGLAYLFGISRHFDKSEIQAETLLESSAKQGNVDAEFWLMLQQRKEIDPFRKLAEQGHVPSMNIVATYEASSQRKPANFAEAMRWWKKAAEIGSGEAEFNIGLMYMNGEGVAKDQSQALRWMKLGAKNGYPLANGQLGAMALQGELGLTPGPEAIAWLKQAAEDDVPAAFFNLGSIYLKGLGTEKDIVESYKWYTLAFEHRQTDVRDELEKAMTAAQISEGVKRVAAWKAAH